MTDAIEERAREIAHESPACDYRGGVDCRSDYAEGHYPACDTLTAAITAALIEAYERGQRDMREACRLVCVRNAAKARDNRGLPTDAYAWGAEAYSTADADAIAALPITTEKECGE